MTTSPSDRAKELWDGLNTANGRSEVIARIAAAITQAENEKLEEAARHIGQVEIKGRVVNFTVNGQAIEDQQGNRQFMPLTEGPKVVAFVQSEIRSLKTPKD